MGNLQMFLKFALEQSNDSTFIFLSQGSVSPEVTASGTSITESQPQTGCRTTFPLHRETSLFQALIGKFRTPLIYITPGSTLENDVDRASVQQPQQSSEQVIVNMNPPPYVMTSLCELSSAKLALDQSRHDQSFVQNIAFLSTNIGEISKYANLARLILRFWCAAVVLQFLAYGNMTP